MVSLAVREESPPARRPLDEDLAPPLVDRLEVEVRGLERRVEPRFLFEPMRGVPVFGVVLPLYGVRVEGFELRGLLEPVLVAVLRVPEIEGTRRELMLDDGIRLVLDPDVVGTRRYRSRRDGFFELVLRVTGLTV